MLMEEERTSTSDRFTTDGVSVNPLTSHHIAKVESESLGRVSE